MCQQEGRVSEPADLKISAICSGENFLEKGKKEEKSSPNYGIWGELSAATP
jgi:hypothetical protein